MSVRWREHNFLLQIITLEIVFQHNSKLNNGKFKMAAYLNKCCFFPSSFEITSCNICAVAN